MEYEIRTTEVTVVPVGKELFDECATSVRIEDEAAGEFIVVSQARDDAESGLKFGADEWQIVRTAIDDMAADCRSEMEDAQS